MKLQAALLASLVPLAYGQVNPCLLPCRDTVLKCIARNVRVSDTPALARCILGIIEQQENPKVECSSCIVDTLGSEGCTRADGTTDMDCVDETVSGDRCNTGYDGQEECDGDDSCNWCPDYGVCASLASCDNFKPDDFGKDDKDKGGKDGKKKDKKSSDDLKFECKSMDGDATAELECMKFFGKKKCEQRDCKWVKKEVMPGGGGAKPDTDKDTNSITTLKDLKKMCKKMFKDADSCFMGCGKGRMKRGKCGAPKKNPADCKVFQDAKMCNMVVGCTPTSKGKCKGKPGLN